MTTATVMPIAPPSPVPTTRPLQLARHHRFEVMGTVVTIDAYADPAQPSKHIESHIARACRVLAQADEVFSTWKPNSPMSRLRRNELGLDQVPAVVAQVLAECRQVRELTDGWFDPWSLPGGVDPTGYVKGWAAARALDQLKVPGVAAAVVNAAGDIASFVADPLAHPPFHFGILDPADTTQLACVVEYAGAVATSGTYERGQHLFNPRTRRLTALNASATVTGPDLGVADALATALAIGAQPVLELLESIPEYEALIITESGNHITTAHFPLLELHLS